jgi:hypothetical protein
MKSIFNKTDNSEILTRIDKLTKDSRAEWGKMNVAQMLEHCKQPIYVATGKLELKRTFIGFMFGKMAKKSLINAKTFKKNLPTDKNFIIKGDRNFDAAKSELMALVKGLGSGEEKIVCELHPFFGKMSMEDWDILHYKHLDHHLRQFGV